MKPNHDNNFNLLRLLLATGVLVEHACKLGSNGARFEWLDHYTCSLNYLYGGLCVNGFFLLSGYLVMQSWQSDPDPARFARRRLLRIYPGFLCATLLSLVLVGTLAGGVAYWSRFSVGPFLLSAVTAYPTYGPPVFHGSADHAINASMWTIDYELRCYVLLCGLGILALDRRPAAWLGITALLVWASMNLDWVDELNRNLVITGVLSYLVVFFTYFMVGASYYLMRRRVRYRLLAVPVLLAVILLAIKHLDVDPARFFLLIPGSYCLLCLGLTKPLPWLAWVRRVDISYGVYIYGWPVQALLAWYWPRMPALWLLAISIAICYPVGWASWSWVERPMLRLKPRRPLVPLAPPVLVTSSAG